MKGWKIICDTWASRIIYATDKTAKIIPARDYRMVK